MDLNNRRDKSKIEVSDFKSLACARRMPKYAAKPPEGRDRVEIFKPFRIIPAKHFAGS
jgi:hypothetical protein